MSLGCFVMASATFYVAFCDSSQYMPWSCHKATSKNTFPHRKLTLKLELIKKADNFHNKKLKYKLVGMSKNYQKFVHFRKKYHSKMLKNNFNQICIYYSSIILLCFMFKLSHKISLSMKFC